MIYKLHFNKIVKKWAETHLNYKTMVHHDLPENLLKRCLGLTPLGSYSLGLQSDWASAWLFNIIPRYIPIYATRIFLNIWSVCIICILITPGAYEKCRYRSPWPVWLREWVQPANQRATSLIPSLGTGLGCGPGPQLGAHERQPHIDVPLPLFLPPFLPLKINK